MTENPIILVGGGGHCGSVIDVLLSANIPIAGIVHGTSHEFESLYELPPLGTDEDLPALRKTYGTALITVGQIKSAEVRKKLFLRAKELNYHLPSILSPFARVARYVTIGEGTVIMHHAVVNIGSKIGNNCIINSKALIEHDCIIGDHCHIAVGAIVCGSVTIGSQTFIGAGVVIREGVTIGERCIIGMGVRIHKDVPDGQLVTE